MRLDGFGIFVNDMSVMVRFYRDVLGFEIKEDEKTASNVYLVKDGTLFLLYGRKDFEKMTNRKFHYAPQINGHYEIALSVENYSAVDAAFAGRFEGGRPRSWNRRRNRGGSELATSPIRRKFD